MKNTKGFARVADPELLASGVLHEPDLSRVYESVNVEETNDRDLQLKSLSIGVPVVASEVLRDQITQSRRFEALDKHVEESRSAHGVSFGRFVGWLPNPGNDRNKEATLFKVAVKPFTSPETALHEIHGYRRLGELSVGTFEPVGIFPALKGDHFLSITKKSERLISLDNEEWVAGRRVSDAASNEIARRNAKTVKDIAQLSAYLNTNGVFLPDGQIKNWVRNTQVGGGVRAIDTENIVETEIGSDDAVQHAWDCTEKLIKSLILDTKDTEAKMFGVGMLAGMTLPQVRENIEELFIVPYVEELERLEEHANSPEERAHIQQLHTGIIDKFYSDKQWPNHLVNEQYANYRR